MLAVDSRCRQCGATLFAAPVHGDGPELCFSCGGTALALLPATVEAATPAECEPVAEVVSPSRSAETVVDLPALPCATAESAVSDQPPCSAKTVVDLPALPCATAVPAVLNQHAPKDLLAPATTPKPVPTANPDGPRRLLGGIAAGSVPAWLLVLGTFLLFVSPRPSQEAAASADALVGDAFLSQTEEQEGLANPFAELGRVVRATIPDGPQASSDDVAASFEREEASGNPRAGSPFRMFDDIPPAWMAAPQRVEAPADMKMGPEAPREDKRRDYATDKELLRQLAAVPDVGLNRKEKITLFQKYAASLKEGVQTPEQIYFEPTATLLAVRPDYIRLPIRHGRSAVLTHKAAEELQVLSKKLHQVLDKLTPKDKQGHRPFTALMERFLRTEMHGKKPEWLRAEALPTLLQMLMHEDTPVRLLLVQLLGEIADKRASVSLAQRAVFDLSREVRQTALEKLRERPPSEYRHVFLDSLHYPWLPAVDHSAEALVALSDREAVPSLLGLLKELETQTTIPENGSRPKIREMVRLKHVDNCITCHPPALNRNDPITGAIPDLNFEFTSVKTRQTTNMQMTRSQAMPPPPPRRPAASSTTANSGGHCPPSGGTTTSGNGGGGTNLPPPPPPIGGGFPPPGIGMLIPGGGGGTTGSSGGGGGGGGYGGTSGSSTTSGSNTSVASVPGHPGWTMSTTKETKINHQEIPVVIRADITYFRQDFSVTQLIGMGPGAEPFRFDYLARTRPLTNQELLLLKKYPEMHPALRQKETVLFALRELTGKDAGNDTLEWLALFPEAAEEVEAVKLCNEFVQASPAKQATLLAMLRDKKGPRYTQALVTAIPRLPEEMQGKARQALTERLARVPSSMLRDRLTEDDYEMRRAAAAACSKKEDRALVPDLIGLLEDGDERVGKAARTSLKTMTGKDHPNPSAWQAWWSEQGSE